MPTINPYTLDMSSTKTALADHVSWRKVEDKGVLLNLESSEYYTFNATGCLLLELLARPQSPEALAERLSEEFEVAPAAALTDVKRFLARLRENGLARPS